jgi:glutamine synthetase
MVGMRSCASGVARPKKGAKVRNVEASKKEPQPRKCKSAYAERQEEASSRAAPDARERIPTGAGDETVGPIISPMHTNDVHQTLGSMSFLEPMSNYMNELGWNLYSFDQEGGHSQFEFDFKYADALTMCDRLTFLRLMAQQVAEEIGATATFMPKPFADDFRSACHFNMSVADAETGVNLFAPESDLNPLAKKYGVATSKLAYHFTAGILRHAAAITAVTSPVYNSYQGLIAQGDMPDISWAPVIIAYGRNNRSAMLRLPLNRYCVENRTPDISCNPYLAAAMQLAAGLEGIEQELDPGQPLNRNCYELTRSELKEIGMNFLPRTLLHALEAFEADPFTERVFGAEFKGIYLKQKLKEWDEGFYPISKSHLEQRLTFI